MSSSQALDQVFAALADPTRRAILARLRRGETTVGRLQRPFAISAPAISRHLRVLRSAGLIANERRGQHRYCRLQGEALAQAEQWFHDYEQFWSAGFGRLERQLRRGKKHAAGRKLDVRSR